MHEGNSKFPMTALAVSLNLRRKQSTGKISLWERVRGTFVTARIVTQGWVVMAMNVAQHPDNKETECSLLSRLTERVENIYTCFGGI